MNEVGRGKWEQVKSVEAKRDKLRSDMVSAVNLKR